MSTLTIDCDYLGPGIAASYLLRDGTHAAFVDNNTSKALPHLLQGLRDQWISPSQVEYLVVTHVHLDHGAGTAALAAACPNATVLCHPRAAPHLIDPTKLVASARHVYGDALFEKLYGNIGPVPAARVRAVEDGETAMLGTHALRFLHTRGHANHHLCMFDETESAIFTGDAFGLAYPALQQKGLFIFPSTSPTDFDPDEALKSIKRIVESGARRAYPTHFGAVEEMAEAARQMEEQIRAAGETLDLAVRSSLPDSELDGFCIERVRRQMIDSMKRRGLYFGKSEEELLRGDIELNGQGIAHVARKRRQKAASPAKP